MILHYCLPSWGMPEKDQPSDLAYDRCVTSTLFLYTDSIYFMYFLLYLFRIFTLLLTLLVRKLIIPYKTITMIEISSSTMAMTGAMTFFTPRLMKIYSIHFKKWSIIRKLTFMVFFIKISLCFSSTKLCEINFEYFLNFISWYYYCRSILEAGKVENLSNISWFVYFLRINLIVI